MPQAELTEMRLYAFKSVRDAIIPINSLTLIVGRNGSGKSNVLDGLAVLSALATGVDLRDALDGGRDGPVVRGGSEGCAPLGTTSFQIGCTVAYDGREYFLDLDVQVSPTVQIRSERLWGKRLSGLKKGEPIDYIKSDPPDSYSADISARWHNEKQGPNPIIAMRANQLLTSQAATRVPATTQAGRKVHEVAAAVLSGISGIFILDPVPHQMREYIPERDNVLRRNADNLSAVLRRLSSEPTVSQTLLEMTRKLSEAQVSNLASVSSELGDVMVTIEEEIGGSLQPVSARLMSDGTLRFLAIIAALLDSPTRSTKEITSGRVLVAEELENGLHPSQAALLLDRLKQTAVDRQTRTVATTHSPAILDALTGDDHRSVMVSTRDADGWSHVDRLTDLPGYFEVVGHSSLGDSAVHDRVRPQTVDRDKMFSTLNTIFGT
ncbi:ATP-binding protein [Mycobacterium marseillense]|uniref:AAA family ATPase n=1 Tax=Mycobacterium marseillense TaxID=701042 RepID=UPI002595BFEB|nr:ATP-binding protein [Mycobacterium marseillense]MDM3974747.1 ATP-binding protein [Mycobacterium marseillense]